MPLIIDGHNLIPKIPGLSLSIIDDEEILIKMLVDYGSASRKQVFLFFDNAPPGFGKTQRLESLTVNFVREGRSADSAIKSKLKRLGKQARNWTVVSSDRDVQRNAKEAGAGVMSSEDFTRILLSILDKYREQPDQEVVSYPDESEIQHWMEIFSDDKQGENE